MVEEVHFVRRYSTLSQAVQKAVTSNISDIYSMGGTPLNILFTAGLPGGCGEDDIEDIIDGLAKGTKAYGVELSGGDTVLSPGGFFFDISVIGRAGKGAAIRRDGGRKGDALVIFGECGGSSAGLIALRSIFDGRPETPFFDKLLDLDDEEAAGIRKILPGLSLLTSAPDIDRLAKKAGLGGKAPGIIDLIRRHLVPVAVRPDITHFPAGKAEITAMTDISDGLSSDLASICRASGTGALVDAGSIPLPPFLDSAKAAGVEELTGLSMSSGEEYSMLAAVRLEDGAELPEGVAVIGRLTGRDEGLMAAGTDGKTRRLKESGFEHDFGTG